MKHVRTRIAPSPTGFAHIGTAYTSLFNYAFAKKNKGKFILRIEDTDIKRHVPKAEEAIFEGLKWLGLNYDEGPDIGGKFGPYRQSERLELYQKYARQLVKSDLAYEDEGAIRFKVPKSGETSWKDLVRGEIVFQNGEIEDFVILKSNSYPTYNFAVVIDDWQMEISHVIRAEEHISNTPRQLLIYQALSVKEPQFAHPPLIRNPDQSKMSKRGNPISIDWYKEQGYLPEALVNFLCLMGWSHPREEDVFSLQEFIELFSFDRVVTSAPVFDFKKLDWLNGAYIRETQDSPASPSEAGRAKLKTQINEFYEGEYSEDLIEKTIPLIKDRIKKLADYQDLAGFFFKTPKINRNLFGKNYKLHLKQAISALEKVENWEKGEIERVLNQLIKRKGWGTGSFFMSFRIAITGSKFTPPITDSVVILGKEETLRRLQSCLKLW